MEINNTSNEIEFEFEKFDFLLRSVPVKAQKGFQTIPLLITCFDLNKKYFIFGSNIGIIYCFKRRENTGPYLKYQLISSGINIIKIISDELLSFVSDSGVYLINWSKQKFLYGWKCPTNAIITSLQTFMSINDHKLLLISGDSEGFLRYHDIVKCEQNVIYRENGFQIIQIEFIDRQTLLISSSLRTVVIECNFSDINNKNIMTQIGKNERKTYGKFGAVYSIKSKIIYGSRPSLHLIKAEVNGNVLETIRLNNVIQSQSSPQLEEFSKVINGTNSYKLGILKLFCGENYMISWNESNLLIIGIDGQFCLKEKLPNLIDVKISHRDSEEAFLLLSSKYIIRIRRKSFSSQEKDFEESSDTESRESDDFEVKSIESRSSTESLINMFKKPINVNTISFIDEELKKAFDKLQVTKQRVTKKFDQLSASILYNHNQNVFVTPVYDSITDESDEKELSTTDNKPEESSEVMSPLVIKTKGKRRLPDKKTNPTNSETDSINNNTEVITEQINCCESDTNNVSKNIEPFDETSDKAKKEDLENSELDHENRLQMILSAYKEANNKLDNLYANQQSINTEFFYSSEISEPNFKSRQIDAIDSAQMESVDKKAKEDLKESPNVVKSLDFKWEKVFNLSEIQQKSIESLLSLCAFGYSTTGKTEIGLIWFISKKENNNCLLYYPSFDELKLSKGSPLQITANPYELYVLTNNGMIFKREGMDATKPVGNKWTNIKTNKIKCKLTSITFNSNKSILWCCDQNGETWTLSAQKWSKINDFSSHSIEMKKVCVSVNDSSIVWGIDKSGKVFARIFYSSGDKNDEICGDHWVLIDGILAIDLVIGCDNRVWIAVEGNRLYERNGKIAENANIEDQWEEVIGPLIYDDSYASISASENNDIWILTAKGCVWHTFDPSNRNSTNEDLDWLLI